MRLIVPSLDFANQQRLYLEDDASRTMSIRNALSLSFSYSLLPVPALTMGGGSFDNPAQRLTTAQLDLLEAHCVKALRPFFPRMKALRNLDSKATHGDLDLMIYSEEMTRGIRWTGSDFQEVKADSEIVYDAPRSDKDGQERKMGNGDEEYVGWQKWFMSITKAVGATSWSRGGGTRIKIAVAIPCAIIDPSVQVDAYPKVSPQT